MVLSRLGCQSAYCILRVLFYEKAIYHIFEKAYDYEDPHRSLSQHSLHLVYQFSFLKNDIIVETADMPEQWPAAWKMIEDYLLSSGTVPLSKCTDGISIDTQTGKGITCCDWISFLGEQACENWNCKRAFNNKSDECWKFDTMAENIAHRNKKSELYRKWICQV